MSYKSIFFEKINFLTIFFFAIFFQNCQPDRTEFIKKEVAKRVEKYRAQRLAEMELKLLNEASKNVDSLLLETARVKLLDSLHRVRPVKPGTPAEIPPLDSAMVKPLF